MIDCCFLTTENSKKSYQSLSNTYSAIEPPLHGHCFWLSQPDQKDLR